MRIDWVDVDRRLDAFILRVSLAFDSWIIVFFSLLAVAVGVNVENDWLRFFFDLAVFLALIIFMYNSQRVKEIAEAEGAASGSGAAPQQ